MAAPERAGRDILTSPALVGWSTAGADVLTRRCGALITADGEDAIVAAVQAHAARDHDLTHPLSREHILAHLEEEQGRAGD